jgi:hypothetical protein
VFLIDRLAGNKLNPIYKKFRKEIFRSYYHKIVSENKDCHLLLMVKKTNDNQQLLKYFHLGFKEIACVFHNAKPHHIIIRDLSTVRSDEI